MDFRSCRQSPVGHLLSRRGFFANMTDGVSGAALAYLFNRELFADASLPAGPKAAPTGRVYDLKPRRPHFDPKAKAVIHFFMNGGPSQMDLFDPKPLLDKHHGQPYLDKMAVADVQDPEKAGALMRSPFKFARHGQSGIWLSEVLPHLAGQVDELAFIRSMVTNTPDHGGACFMANSGQMFPGHPSLGSWVTYGLGSESQNLPAYVVLQDPMGPPVNGSQGWQAGYLPPIYQGTPVRSVGSPLLNLRSEVEEPSPFVKASRDLLRRLDHIHKSGRPGQPRLDARIASYELAARMQLAATDALDLSQESRQTLDMYGVGVESKYRGRTHPISGPDSYARRCIMARRLVERGVRFVQIYINTQIWDMHTHIENDIRAACKKTDQPVAALIHDLKQRGLLDSTLLIWNGEFGRLPIAQFADGKDAGRDHNPYAFTVWMAGGGVKGGTVYGATDDLGYRAVENPVTVADWHATILHQLGLHHEELFFERNGLTEKLTSTHEPRIVQEILA